MHPKQLQPPPNVASIQCINLNISPNESDECLWLSSSENLKEVHIAVRPNPIGKAPSTSSSQITVHEHDALFENVTEETIDALSKIFLHLPARMLAEV